MAHFISGKLKHEGNSTLLDNEKPRTTPLVFSAEAQAVFEAGKALWTYYHKVIKEIPLSSLTKETLNASFYDIRAYFQGRNEQGKMNNKSEDETYNELLDNLRDALKVLAQKIEPKVYEYGFLKR
jgi:hypothetical protein